MQSIGYYSIGSRVRRHIVEADLRAPAGPAAATLASVLTRTISVIRYIVAAYTVVQVGIWHSFYAPGPWRLAGPAVAVGWVVVLVASLARRPPPPWLIVADSVVIVTLCLSGRWWVPPDMRGDTASWLYIQVVAQPVLPLWCARLALAVPLVLASGAAYLAGTVFLSGALAPNSAPGASTALFFTVAAVAWIGCQMLHRRAIGADTALAEADTAEHEQYVALRRHTERREHERLLHDTVLNTLTALSRRGPANGPAKDGPANGPASGPAKDGPAKGTARGTRCGDTDLNEVIGRCKHDVALMEFVLCGARDADHPAQHGGDPHGALLVTVNAVALEMRARGLDVHVRTQVGGGEQTSDAGPGSSPAPLPVPVVVAVVRAVREALGNVARHAGTDEAWVEICLGESGAGRRESGGLTVTVRDRGIGFDPRRVGPDRLGIARSIVERIEDCGGMASVRSAPGHGTTVTMRLPAAADALVAPGTSAPGTSAPGTSAPGTSAPGTSAPGWGVR
jgi:signal transduction histidine kinase